MNQIYINIKDMNECYFKRYLQEQFKKDIVSIDEILGLLEDLKGDYDSLEEKFEDFKQDVEDNYKPVSYEEQIGYNRNW